MTKDELIGAIIAGEAALRGAKRYRQADGLAAVRDWLKGALSADEGASAITVVGLRRMMTLAGAPAVPRKRREIRDPRS
jgi:hypothetical protein